MKNFKKPWMHIRELEGKLYTFQISRSYLYFGVFKALYSEKGVTSFFDFQFLGVLGIVEKKLITYLES